MTWNAADLFAERERERFAMHTRHLNEQMVRVLKTIGYDVVFAAVKANISMIDKATAILTC